MLSSLKNMFKVPDLRGKILFTLFILLLYRFGSHLPVPGIDINVIQQIQKETEHGGGALQFVQLFSGSAITGFAVFALGIMPYITASIILQVLTVVIPKLEEWQQQGAIGQRKITQWTRYVTLGISVLQGVGLTFLFHSGGSAFFGPGNQTGHDLFGPGNFTAPRILLCVLSLTAGAMLLMWMGELVTQRGVGNGMSLIIFCAVASRIPSDFGTVKAEKGLTTMFLVAVLFTAMMVAIVFVQNGQRRIPVNFAKRVVGRRMYGGQSTYIPLRVDSSGVIAIIFASAVLYLPVMISQAVPVKAGQKGWGYEVQRFVNKYLVSPTSLLYIAIYAVLIVGFCYFYNAIQFDPHQQADNIRKQGGFIPGIRPGPQTERHLSKILNRITLPGALFTAVIALVPAYFLGRTLSGGSGAAMGFFGISVLIMVEVALETVKQIDSHLMMRNYEGFLKS
ncbi:MAG TPA: preprotein translocase subunit SecY [Acidimicrobiales bacterium]|nr:preprotein translocase subunit SecY [Acidimicrobiales bacterium]